MMATAPRTRFMFLVVALALAPMAVSAQDVSSPGPSRNSHSQPALEGIRASRLSLPQTIEMSEQQLGGRAVQATFTPFATGGGSHEVVVLRPDGTLTRNHIDGNSKSTVGVTNEKLSSLVTSLTPQAVQGAQKTLLEVVREADARDPDQRVIGAAADQEDDVVTYEVTIATKDGEETLEFDSSGKPLQ